MDWKKLVTDSMDKLNKIPGYEKLGANSVKQQVESFVKTTIKLLEKIAQNSDNAKRFQADFKILENRINGIEQLAIAKAGNYIKGLILDLIPESVIPQSVRKIIL